MDGVSTTGSVKIYRSQYVRNYRAIGVLWGIFTVLLAILLIVVFTQPQWLGDTSDSVGVGHFGVYKYCYREGNTPNSPFACSGSFTEFNSILSAEWKAVTFFVGFTALLYLLCCACLLLFFFMNTAIVFMICAWIQVVATVCIFLGCVIYPAGWDDDTVQMVCGPECTDFKKDQCEIRWAYILAILCIFDSLVLCILAFVLATRQAKLLPGASGTNGHLSKSEMGDERRSYIPPVMAASENMSLYSYQTGKSGKRSGYRGDFQL